MKLLRINIILLILLAVISFAQPNYETNEYRLAVSYESVGNYAKALEIFKDLFIKNKGVELYYQGYYRNLVQLKDYSNALDLLKERLKIYPNNYELLGNEAILYYRLDDKMMMDKTINDAISLDKKNYLGYRIIANILIENRLFEKAIEVLEIAKVETENKFNFLYDLANLYTILMNYQSANKVLVEILATDNNQIAFVQQKLQQILTKPDGKNISLEIFKDASKENKDKVFKKIYAWILFEIKNFKDAFETVVELDKESNSNGGDIFNYGQRAFMAKEYSIAIDAYNYLINNYNINDDLKIYAIYGIARSNEELLAQNILTAENKWKNNFYPLTNGTVYSQAAIDNFKKLIDQYPGSIFSSEAVYRLAYINYEYFQNIPEAKKYLEKLIKEYPYTSWFNEAKMLQSDIYLFDGEIEKAKNVQEEILKDARSSENDKFNSMYNLSVALILLDKIDSAKTFLTELNKKKNLDISNDVIELLILLTENENNKSYLQKFILARNNLDHKKYDEALNKFEEIAQTQNENSLAAMSRLLMADIYIIKNEYSLSISNLQFIINLKDKTYIGDKALYRLGEIYLYGLKDKTTAIKTFEQLLEEYPNSLLINKTRNLIQQNKIGQI